MLSLQVPPAMREQLTRSSDDLVALVGHSGRIDLKIFANLTNHDFFNFRMSRNGSQGAGSCISPDRMPRTFSKQLAIMSPQMLEKLRSLHIAIGTSSKSFSADRKADSR